MISQDKNQPRNFKIKALDWFGEISQSRVFWIVLSLKVVASFFFVAPVLTDLFIPFIESFVAAPLTNVYDTFWRQGLEESFPYPTVMLAIMSLPRLILYWIGFETLTMPITLFVYRIPLILADIAIFLVLYRWLRQKIKLLLWLYWASPVFFYITYIHGQLDVIAMAIAFLSIYFLFSNRWLQSAVLLAVAVSAKMHLLLLLPFGLIYLWQSERRIGAGLLYFGVTCGVFLIVNLPYLFSASFIHMVLLNKQQSKLGLVTFNSGIDSIAFYIIPALLLILLFYSLIIQIRNRDVFLFFIGSTFSVLLLFIPPAPGWYYWIIPFMIYYFARLSASFLLPLVALQIAYFVYFVIIPPSDFAPFLELPTNLYKDLAFTALQTLLFINTVLMLIYGVHLPQQSKLMARPFMIGIAGDSGVGKTTLAVDLQAVLGEKRLGLICGDDMHKWERGHTRWNELTHLNPLANELHDELEFIKNLRENKRLYRRHYDHNIGKFTGELAIIPRAFMVHEGLHSFYLKPTRDLFDLKIFIKPDESLLRHRKVVRDIKKRGSSKEMILQSIAVRQADLAQFIAVQERHADIVLSFIPLIEIAQVDIGKPDLVIQERLRITLSNSYSLGPIVSDLIKILPDCVRHFYDVQDHQVIELDPSVGQDEIRIWGEKHVKGLDFFGIYDPPWNNGWTGVLQLVITYCIFNDWEQRQ